MVKFDLAGKDYLTNLGYAWYDRSMEMFTFSQEVFTDKYW